MDAPCMDCDCCRAWQWRDQKQMNHTKELFEMLMNRIYNVRAEFRIAPPSFDERRVINRHMEGVGDGPSES